MKEWKKGTLREIDKISWSWSGTIVIMCVDKHKSDIALILHFLSVTSPLFSLCGSLLKVKKDEEGKSSIIILWQLIYRH